MGDEGVGKSCLIKRYCEEKFVSKYISTIGVDFGVKPVKLGGQSVRVNFWDLAGGDEYFEIRNEFYKDCNCALLVYDVNERASFAQVSSTRRSQSALGTTELTRPMRSASCAPISFARTASSSTCGVRRQKR